MPPFLIDAALRGSMSLLRGFGMKAFASSRGLTLGRLCDVAVLRLRLCNAFGVRVRLGPITQGSSLARATLG